MRAKFVFEKFTEHSDPIADMKIGYGKRGETTAFKILEFIESKGKEGASFTEIQHFILTELRGMSEEDFWKESPFGGRGTRGYWVGGLYGSNDMKHNTKGLLYKWCEKDPKTKKWVLTRFPRPGEKLFDTQWKK